MKIDFDDLDFYGADSGWCTLVEGSSSGSVGGTEGDGGYWRFPVAAIEKHEVRTKGETYAARYEVIMFAIKVAMPRDATPLRVTEEDEAGNTNFRYGWGRERMWNRINEYRPPSDKVARYVRMLARSAVFEPKHLYGVVVPYDSVMQSERW